MTNFLNLISVAANDGRVVIASLMDITEDSICNRNASLVITVSFHSWLASCWDGEC